MPGVLERREMGRPKGRPKSSDRDDVTVKIEREIVEKARLIAPHRNVTIAELLSEMLRDRVDQAFLEMVRALEAKTKAKGPK